MPHCAPSGNTLEDRAQRLSLNLAMAGFTGFGSMDAAASRFRLPFSDAAEQAASEAREAAAARPDYAQLKRTAELARAAAQLGAEALARRRNHKGGAQARLKFR